MLGKHVPPQIQESSSFFNDVMADLLGGLIAGAILLTVGYFLIDRRLNLREAAARRKHDADHREHNRRIALEALHADLTSAAALIRVSEKALPNGQVPYPLFETGTLSVVFDPAILTTLESATVMKLLQLRNRVLTTNEFTLLAFDLHFGPTAILAKTIIATGASGSPGTSAPWKDFLGNRAQVRDALLQRIHSVEPHLHAAIDAVEGELGITGSLPSAQRDYVGPDPIGLFAAAGADLPEQDNGTT